MIEKLKTDMERQLRMDIYYDNPGNTQDYIMIRPANFAYDRASKDGIVIAHYYFDVIISVINKEDYKDLEDTMDLVNDYMMANEFDLLNTTYQKTDSNNMAILSYTCSWGVRKT